MSFNISYFEAPEKFVLYPSPTLHILRTDAVVLNQKELASKEVRLVIVDWQCDSVKTSVRFVDPKHEECIEIYCGFDSTRTHIPYGTPDNYWTKMNSWIFRKEYKCKGLRLVVLSEQFLGIEDVKGKFGTYVDFLRPDVVVVNEYWFKTGIHEQLMDHYNEFSKLDLQEEGEIVVWLYFDNHMVSVAGDRGKDCSILEIKRLKKV